MSIFLGLNSRQEGDRNPNAGEIVTEGTNRLISFADLLLLRKPEDTGESQSKPNIKFLRVLRLTWISRGTPPIASLRSATLRGSKKSLRGVLFPGIPLEETT